jgi:hypothetical protein
MSPSSVVACRSCRASICFVEMPSGKRMPLDAAAITTSDPKVVLYTLYGPLVPRREGEEATGHVSHFATCPDTKRWSRR